jgi:nucleoside-diphosphate-sugar epimerase
MEVPAAIRDVAHLEQLLSEPSGAAVEAMRRANGDVIVLGAAGKMGPTLARMARRAIDVAGLRHRVIAVSRFASPDQQRTMEGYGVETIRCDLLDEPALARLPDAPHVVFMAGRKFGSHGNEPLTWAMNAHLPALVCARYRSSRIVAFSTGNVYGLTPPGRGGSREEDLPAPIGEYAMSCLARERMFEYFSETFGFPVAILRLNYATEMRYGVLVDLARRVSRGEPVDVTMGYFNTIWQGDASAMALAALNNASMPASIVNIAGPEEVSVRRAATELARLLDTDVAFTGREADDALLSNGSRGWALLGRPRVGIEQLISWTADWTRRGGDHLGKPTQFESRAGRF